VQGDAVAVEGGEQPIESVLQLARLGGREQRFARAPERARDLAPIDSRRRRRSVPGARRGTLR
jgi:hypothetical protein